jgi:hypothetical protein
MKRVGRIKYYNSKVQVTVRKTLNNSEVLAAIQTGFYYVNELLKFSSRNVSKHCQT